MYRISLRNVHGERVYPHPLASWVRARAESVAGRRTPRLPRWALAVALVAGVVSVELRTSWVQSTVLASVARQLTYSVEPGASTSIRFPVGGPHDVRLGYTAQTEFVKRLSDRGFQVEAQARWSPALVHLAEAGFSPVYQIESQAGLSVLDAGGRPLFSSHHPQYAYRSFAEIPPPVVDSLLFIENRELLQADHRFRNPAVEYDRLAKAVLDVGLNRVFTNHQVSGGSTLAIQLEKLRHSPDGRTGSVIEKGRQIVSASLRSYLDGADTTGARRHLVTEYINSMPLAAIAGHGEVLGLGDGLHAWYGADVHSVNELLREADLHRRPAEPMRTKTATAHRQGLSLLAALKKP